MNSQNIIVLRSKAWCTVISNTLERLNVDIKYQSPAGYGKLDCLIQLAMTALASETFRKRNHRFHDTKVTS